MHKKPFEDQSPNVNVVWEFREYDATSDVLLVAGPWLKIMRRKHIFRDGRKDVQLSCEDDLRLFNRQSNCCNSRNISTVAKSSTKYAFSRPEVILSMVELKLDQAPQDINKEFQLERVSLKAFVDATDPGCKKELIRSGSLSPNLKMAYETFL
ncbi:hypothetical protein TNCV_4610901 [Trichonephila clavipes]|nr:hypothetical protein TNCV_4610901 [Trichonephila clavipes]